MGPDLESVLRPQKFALLTDDLTDLKVYDFRCDRRTCVSGEVLVQDRPCKLTNISRRGARIEGIPADLAIVRSQPLAVEDLTIDGYGKLLAKARAEARWVRPEEGGVTEVVGLRITGMSRNVADDLDRFVKSAAPEDE